MRFFGFRLMVSRSYGCGGGLMMVVVVMMEMGGVVFGELILGIRRRFATRLGLLLEWIEDVLRLVWICFSLNVLKIMLCIVLFSKNHL